MAFKLAKRVKETTTTTGTGTLNLGGAATGFQTLVAGIGSGNTTAYLVKDASGNWERGIGTVTKRQPGYAHKRYRSRVVRWRLEDQFWRRHQGCVLRLPREVRPAVADGAHDLVWRGDADRNRPHD